MTILSRLHGKGIVERRRKGSQISTAEGLPSRLPGEAGQGRGRRAVGEYGELALAQFARQVSEAGPDEVERLRKLTDDES